MSVITAICDLGWKNEGLNLVLAVVVLCVEYVKVREKVFDRKLSPCEFTSQPNNSVNELKLMVAANL